jgi:hypothetical protein
MMVTLDTEYVDGWMRYTVRVDDQVVWVKAVPVRKGLANVRDRILTARQAREVAESYRRREAS